MTTAKQDRVSLTDGATSIWADRVPGGWKVYRRQKGQRARFEGFFLGDQIPPEVVLEQLKGLMGSKQ